MYAFHYIGLGVLVGYMVSRHKMGLRAVPHLVKGRTMPWSLGNLKAANKLPSLAMGLGFAYYCSGSVRFLTT